MQHGIVDRRRESQVTRRRVVETGVRLAYAAPIIAASFKLRSAAAQILSPACIGGSCGTFGICSEDDLCVCVATDDGNGFCHRCQQCDTATPCTSQADCPGGYLCSANNCCGEPVCMQPCAGTTSDCPAPTVGLFAASLSVRTTTG
jgi:hypothetical protein